MIRSQELSLFPLINLFFLKSVDSKVKIVKAACINLEYYCRVKKIIREFKILNFYFLKEY